MKPTTETGVKPLKIHPIAELFPMMSDEELQSLAEDIKTNGLLHPIVVDEDGQVVDGRNRLAACEKAGIEPQFEKLNGKDPRAFIVSANLEHRFLTKGQRAMAMAMIYPEPTKLKRKDSGSKETLQQFSKMRLSQARKVVAFSEAIAKDVLKGITKLDEALEMVDKERRKLEGRETDLKRIRKDAPDLADKVNEEEISLEAAIAKYNEQLEILRNIIADGEVGLRQIKTFSTGVLSVWSAVRSGSKLLTDEIVKEAVESATRLQQILTEQKEMK